MQQDCLQCSWPSLGDVMTTGFAGAKTVVFTNLCHSISINV